MPLDKVQQFLQERGHAQSSLVADATFQRLPLHSVEVATAIASFQKIAAFDIERLRLSRDYHGREMRIDGEWGPALDEYAEMLQTGKDLLVCGRPDYGLMAGDPGMGLESIGSGPWKGCHDVGEYHAVNVHWTNSPPPHLLESYSNPDRPEIKTRWHEILHRVRGANREMGILIHWSGAETARSEPLGKPYIPASFVRSSSGWIGLALLGNNGLGCDNSNLWCRFLETFARSSSVESMIRGWCILILHELGHNWGMDHSSGGIMNPTLLAQLLATWIGDTREGWMRDRFGGQAVPLDDVPEPGPGPTPDPPLPPPDNEGCVRIAAALVAGFAIAACLVISWVMG